MLENKNPSKTPIKNLGEFALIDHITKGFTIENESSQHGASVLPHHCQLEVKKCNEMLCGFSQLSAVRGLLGTAGGERAECSLSRNQFSNISLVTFEKPLLLLKLGLLLCIRYKIDNFCRQRTTVRNSD